MASRPDCEESEVISWFAGQLPDDWFIEPVKAEIDRDEILVTGQLAVPKSVPDGEENARVAAESRIASFRESSRNQRVQVAHAAQTRWLRIVSWAVICGDETKQFKSTSVPVMTRLYMSERQTLDTLIEAGVARSRSDGLSWCVQQVQQHQSEWIEELQDAIKTVEAIRAKGPPSSKPKIRSSGQAV